MISNLLMISPIDIGSSFWSGRTRITLICRTLLIECFGINFILLIPWRAPHLRVMLHYNSGSAASRCQNWVPQADYRAPTQDATLSPPAWRSGDSPTQTVRLKFLAYWPIATMHLKILAPPDPIKPSSSNQIKDIEEYLTLIQVLQLAFLRVGGYKGLRRPFYSCAGG